MKIANNVVLLLSLSWAYNHAQTKASKKSHIKAVGVNDVTYEVSGLHIKPTRISISSPLLYSAYKKTLVLCN